MPLVVTLHSKAAMLHPENVLLYDSHHSLLTTDFQVIET